MITKVKQDFTVLIFNVLEDNVFSKCASHANFFAHTLWLFASIKLVTEHAKEWLAISKYLLADACFSKKPFLDQVLQAGMHLVSRLRDAADLKYLHQGEKSPQKVDLNCMPER